MKKYEIPEMLIVKLPATDVITTSAKPLAGPDFGGTGGSDD